MHLGSKRFLALALFTALLIILVNFAWWFYYQRTEVLLERQLSRRLISIAEATSLSFSPGLVDSLATSDVDAFSEVTSKLETVRAADSLADLFVLDDKYNYLATTQPDPDSSYFLAELNGPYIDSLFFGFVTRALPTATYRTGALLLKSAFAPLKNGSNEVVAVLGVEANVDYFDDLRRLRRNVMYTAGISVLGGLVLGLLFLVLQQNLNKTEQQLFLGQTHAYLGRMVAVVSHEVKNPLMIIRGSAERLVKKTGADEARYIVEETDRLNNIVSGYLDFARTEGPLLINESPEQFLWSELCVSLKKHFEGRYVGQTITWCDDEGEDLEIVGYRRSLRQILLNLLINGAEANLANGKPITVGLTAKAEDDRVKIRVSDKGPGLSKKEMRKIFTPFYTTKQSGSGLGLYLSRMLAHEMSGSIRVESHPGEGTSVTVEIPREVRR